MANCPNLPDVAMWTLPLVSASTEFENLQYSQQVAVLMELHFSHFFSKERSDWTSEDIRYVAIIHIIHMFDEENIQSD